MPEPRLAYNVPLPPDLNLAIMVMLSFHLGPGNAISRTRLRDSLREFAINEGQLRERIKHLRRSGHLVGESRGSSEHPERSGAKLHPVRSLGTKDQGENGGYYLITTPGELKDFLCREYQAKINDMQQTVEAMTKAASQRWGPDTIQLKVV